MRVGLVVVWLAACYAPRIATGVPCDPAAPACPRGQTCTTDGVCLPGGSPTDAATRDGADPDGVNPDGPVSDGATPDGAPALACPADPNLRLCFSFDATVLTSPLANEGAGTAPATLVNVTRIPQGTGGAASIGTTSSIYVPPSTAMPSISSIEIWLRFDADPPANGRVGIVDAETVAAPLSLFYYRDPNHRLRCQLGNTQYVTYTAPLGTYVYLACVCNGNTLQMFVDGVKVNESAGCSPGDGDAYGVQLGQNGNALSGGAPDEWMTGAIDRVRLWSTPLSATAICVAAGRTGC